MREIIVKWEKYRLKVEAARGMGVAA
jgi:hypothetical protein